MTHAAGTTFDVDQLREAIPTGEGPVCRQAGPEKKLGELCRRGRCLLQDWTEPLEDDAWESLAPFVELLIAVRAQLRAARQWALADEIRQRLSKLGIILEDGPTETTWRRD